MRLLRISLALLRLLEAFKIARERASTSVDVVLVGLSTGSTAVYLEAPAPDRVPPYQTIGNAGQMDMHQLFSNWWKFLPGHVQPLVHVVCLDQGAADVAKSMGVAHEQVPDSGHWAWRIEAVGRFLRKGRSVLVSDIDAVWLQDPLPALRRTAEDVVGMREFTGWHTLNQGCVLFRPAFASSIETWLATVRGSSMDDQPAFERTFFPQMSWSEEADTGMTVGTHPSFTLRLLPVHQFPRNFVLFDGCSRCGGGVILQEVVASSRCCVDDQVVMLHHKGEVYRSSRNCSASSASGGVHLWKLCTHV